ncbi:hypothetical protein J7T55_005150 [Diaporthe amygdali]|uniref:uncharacterized protein n=1 Tax=Phomopsis amygdali TaxID=1214568 RepID=UPI0022FE7E7A|nr:uncharacterized protein J7T55_005150 [Diaporthe amygdali]KAJ0116204.1 hypothetical protein J7T55_005150 [Diaporthe amygdali]
MAGQPDDKMPIAADVVHIKIASKTQLAAVYSSDGLASSRLAREKVEAITEQGVSSRDVIGQRSTTEALAAPQSIQSFKHFNRPNQAFWRVGQAGLGLPICRVT